MNLNLTFKHMEASEAVRTYTLEKSEKLKKFFEGKISVTWNFVVEKQEQIAHCHLVGNHIDYFGEGRTPDIYASIDAVIERLEKQLRKHKEIVTNHHGAGRGEPLPESDSESA